MKRSWYIIPHANAHKINFDLFVLILAVWNSFIVPVEVAFEPEWMTIWVYLCLEYFIDFVFVVDIVLNFFTSFQHPKTGDNVNNCALICWHYVKGRFSIDLISAIPFELVGSALFREGNNAMLQLFGLCKLVRVLRLGRLLTFINLKENLKLSFKLINLIFFLILYLHMVGCMWFYLVN